MCKTCLLEGFLSSFIVLFPISILYPDDYQLACRNVAPEKPAVDDLEERLASLRRIWTAKSLPMVLYVKIICSDRSSHVVDRELVISIVLGKPYSSYASTWTPWSQGLMLKPVGDSELLLLCSCEFVKSKEIVLCRSYKPSVWIYKSEKNPYIPWIENYCPILAVVQKFPSEFFHCSCYYWFNILTFVDFSQGWYT